MNLPANLAGVFAMVDCSLSKTIEIKDVPPVIISSALEAVPGFVVTKVELGQEDGVFVYELGRGLTDFGFGYDRRMGGRNTKPEEV